MQSACKDAAEKFAACDMNWWTCIPEEVGPRAEAKALDCFNSRLAEGGGRKVKTASFTATVMQSQVNRYA